MKAAAASFFWMADLKQTLEIIELLASEDAGAPMVVAFALHLPFHDGYSTGVNFPK